MKSNKGITLVSLIGYVILSIMVISVLIAITSNFRKNFNELDVQAVQDVELDKINMQISKEIKDGKTIDKLKTTSTKLTFMDGNVYTYNSDDSAIYMNEDVILAKKIKNCTFEIVDDEILRIIAETEDITRTLEYALSENYVARIEKKYYKTLQSAINAVKANNVETTITLLTDITEDINVVQNQNIVLDIGIWKIKNSGNDTMIEISGNLKIKNGTIKSDITQEVPAILIYPTGKLTITGGTIDSVGLALKNQGNLDISGTSTIIGSQAISNEQESISIIKGGEIFSRNSGAIANSGTLIMEGGLVTTAATIYNNGITTIKGGLVKSDSAINLINNVTGTLTIEGTAVIEGSGNMWTMNNSANATLNVTGGTINGNSANAIYVQQNAITNISGGTLTSSSQYTVISLGKMTISGGTIINTSNKYAIYNWAAYGGTCTFSASDVTVVGKTYGI